MLSLWHQRDACDPCVPAGDAPAARLWLLSHSDDEALLILWRGLLWETGEAPVLSGLGREALLDQLAAAIAGGALRVCGRGTAAPLYRLVGAPAPVAPAASVAPAAALSPATAAAAAPPSAADTTFDSDLDTAAMAATLRQAANDGVPFCEICARQAAAA